MASLLAGLTALGPMASAARAQPAGGNVLTWSTANASVGVCKVGVTCGQPNGVTLLARDQSTDTNTDFNRAAVGPPDYLGITSGAYFGNAWASAEAGAGLLGLPQLHAFAESRNIGVGFLANPTIGVDVALVQAVQGYTNTSQSNMVIPLSAFGGIVDYRISGAVGTISAGLAITTSAILDPAVAALWSATGSGSNFGQFTAGCGTAGALAIGAPAAVTSNPSPNTQFLSVDTTSCSNSANYTLAPDETFYVWARLAVIHTSTGVTDAANTFAVTIAPSYQQEIQRLAPSLAFASGANLDIPVEGVPEPGSWVLMLVGFGAIGTMVRSRNRRSSEQRLIRA